MPRRLITFNDNDIYHIFNRGVAKQVIFNNHRFYTHFERAMGYYQKSKNTLSFSRYLDLKPESQSEYIKKNILNNENSIEIIAFCLMPNHYHLLVKQLKPNGISTYMQQLGNSYTRYFNTKTHRIGPLFQGQFKAVLIESGEQLIHVSRYIHLNPFVAGLLNLSSGDEYIYSSFTQYVSGSPANLHIVNPVDVLSHFSSMNRYQKFCLDQLHYASTITFHKPVLIDSEE